VATRGAFLFSCAAVIGTALKTIQPFLCVGNKLFQTAAASGDLALCKPSRRISDTAPHTGP
jgi:hypothetical protein